MLGLEAGLSGGSVGNVSMPPGTLGSSQECPEVR